MDFYKKFSNKNDNVNTLGWDAASAWNDENQSGFYNLGLKEPSVEDSNYKALLEDAKNYSDTAVVVISRQGGESEDFPTRQYKNMPTKTIDESRHQLQISTEEEALLTYAGANFKNVIVLINSTNTFELGFLDTIPGLDACLVVGGTGNEGAVAIPWLIYGVDDENKKVSPSGRLVDTYAYDFKKNVNYNYTGFNGVSFYNSTDTPYGVNQKTNAGIAVRPSLPYVDYVEGIYVGYRWYETAAVEGAFNNEKREVLDPNDESKKIEKTGFDAVVQYPFGYGLSYTDFSWDVISVKKYKDDPSKDGENLQQKAMIDENLKVEIQVKVTNTGKYPGQDVVQLYQTPEYVAGEVEKSAVNLVDFDKTSVLEPGKNEILKLTVSARDLASYDSYDANKNNHTGYEIDSGDYVLKLMDNSHQIKKVNFVAPIQEENVDGTWTLHANKDLFLDKDPVTGAEVKNLFTGDNAIDGVPVDGITSKDPANIPYIKRSDFKTIQKPIEKTSTHDPASGRVMSDAVKKNVLFAGADRSDQTKFNAWAGQDTDAFGKAVNKNDVAWGTGNSGPITAKVTEDGKTVTKPTELGYELGADFNSPKWDEVLNTVKYGEAINLVNYAHPYVKGISSIQMPQMYDLDGPNQFGGFGTGGDFQRGVGYPNSTVLAQTWNPIVAYEFGLSMGSDIVGKGDGYYGPAVNIHRTPFAGRNFEYYSEDPRISGIIGANVAKGVRHTGKISYVKHFAAAETETSRDSLYTWMSEQALREIYIDAFRIIVQEGDTMGIMTSYNRVGSVWAGGSEALMTGVLRNEWGYKGAVITDFSDNNQFMNLDETLIYGGDLGMNVGLKFNYEKGRASQALRNSVKHTIYAYLHAQWSNREYLKNPWEGKVIESGSSTPSFDWVTPVVLDLTILLGVGAFSLIYFGIVHDLIFKKKKVSGDNVKQEEKVAEPIKEDVMNVQAVNENSANVENNAEESTNEEIDNAEVTDNENIKEKNPDYKKFESKTNQVESDHEER